MTGKVPADAAELDALVEQMRRQLRPGLVFHNAWVGLRCRGESEYEHGYTLAGLTAIPHREQRERDRDIAARCSALLVPHPGFRQLRDTYAALGVRAVFHSYAEYHGEWHSFSLFVRDEHLPALERLAQDELGLASDEEREKAAETFRIYPKSRAKQLHRNEIEIEKPSATRVSFVPFLGISPFRYRDIFEKQSRKISGKATQWHKSEPRPMLTVSAPAYLDLEYLEIGKLGGHVQPDLFDPRSEAGEPTGSE